MSWHESVDGDGEYGVPDGCSGIGGPFWRLLSWPVASSLNSRGPFTSAAFCGAPSGTLITSIRNCDRPSSKCGVATVVPEGSALQLASSAAERTAPVPFT
jgi:hypothetical protein